MKIEITKALARQNTRAFLWKGDSFERSTKNESTDGKGMLYILLYAVYFIKKLCYNCIQEQNWGGCIIPLSNDIKAAVYQYCNNHLADEAWYNGEFEFIEDQALRRRLVEEFKGIRFAYKLYEGIEAKDENLIFC